MKHQVTAAAALALLLVGCGGGSKGPTGPVTLDQLAARVGCTFTDRDGDALTPTSGDCRTSGGQTVEIATFIDHKTRDAWLLFVRATGGVAEGGDLWAVSGSDAAATKAAAAAIRR